MFPEWGRERARAMNLIDSYKTLLYPNRIDWRSRAHGCNLHHSPWNFSLNDYVIYSTWFKLLMVVPTRILVSKSSIRILFFFQIIKITQCTRLSNACYYYSSDCSTFYKTHTHHCANLSFILPFLFIIMIFIISFLFYHFLLQNSYPKITFQISKGFNTSLQLFPP